MNNMFSKAAIWVVIALVLFTVFKQFDNRGMAAGATPIAYSDFITEIKAGRIKAYRLGETGSYRIPGPEVERVRAEWAYKPDTSAAL